MNRRRLRCVALCLSLGLPAAAASVAVAGIGGCATTHGQAFLVVDADAASAEPGAGGLASKTAGDAGPKDPKAVPAAAPQNPAEAAKPPAGVEGDAAPPKGGRVREEERVAEVGGKAIGKRELVERLLATEGAKMLDALVEIELARQMAVEAGVKADYAAERRRFLVDFFREELSKRSPTGAIPDSQVLPLVENILRRRNVDLHTTELELERYFYLDRIARKDVQISDDDLRKEFDRTYGERLHLRVIKTRNLNEAGIVMKALKAGEDFAKLAARAGNEEAAGAGGMLTPKARGELPGPIEKEVFKLRQGEIGQPIVYGSEVFIFQLVQKDPAQNVRFEQVTEELRVSVEQQQVRKGMAELTKELRRRKGEKVVYHDERLRPATGR
jgi:parvulin-like peptidyl-prolyl isomerase